MGGGVRGQSVAVRVGWGRGVHMVTYTGVVSLVVAVHGGVSSLVL